MENKSKMLRSEMRAAILDFGTASKGIFLVILVTWHEVVHEHFYDMSKISQSMSIYLAFKSFCSVLSIFGECLLIWLSSSFCSVLSIFGECLFIWLSSRSVLF